MMAERDEYEAQVLASLQRLDAVVVGTDRVAGLVARVVSLEASQASTRDALARLHDEIDAATWGEMRRIRWLLILGVTLAVGMIGLAVALALRGTP